MTRLDLRIGNLEITVRARLPGRPENVLRILRDRGWADQSGLGIEPLVWRTAVAVGLVSRLCEQAGAFGP